MRHEAIEMVFAHVGQGREPPSTPLGCIRGGHEDENKIQSKFTWIGLLNFKVSVYWGIIFLYHVQDVCLIVRILNYCNGVEMWKALGISTSTDTSVRKRREPQQAWYPSPLETNKQTGMLLHKLFHLIVQGVAVFLCFNPSWSFQPLNL